MSWEHLSNLENLRITVRGLVELGEPKVKERSAYGGEAIGWTCIRMGFIASWQKQKWANNKPVHLSPHLHTPLPHSSFTITEYRKKKFLWGFVNYQVYLQIKFTRLLWLKEKKKKNKNFCLRWPLSGSKARNFTEAKVKFSLKESFISRFQFSTEKKKSVENLQLKKYKFIAPPSKKQHIAWKPND